LRRTPRNCLEGFFLFAADQFADSSQSFFLSATFRRARIVAHGLHCFAGVVKGEEKFISAHYKALP